MQHVKLTLLLALQHNVMSTVLRANAVPRSEICLLLAQFHIVLRISGLLDFVHHLVFWTKSINPVILGVIHHHQNPSESICMCGTEMHICTLTYNFHVWQ
jgi:hypothetical protein